MTIPAYFKNSTKDILSDAYPFIQKFAPVIGSAIGGGPGFAIGALIPILANAFGTHPGNLKQLIENITTDPNAAEKLAQIDHEHSGWLCAMTDSVDRLTSAEINVKLSWASPKSD